MNKSLLVLSLIALILIACSPPIEPPPPVETAPPTVAPTPTELPTPTQPPTPTEPPATPTPAAKACPTETAALKLFTNTHDGYCLLYPAEDAPNPPYLIVINPNGMPGDVPGDAWVQISAEDASGRSAGQVADQQITEAGDGFTITRSEILIDGKQAVVVDGLPGPDSWRKVFVAANEQFYTLYFIPWAPNADGFPRLEKLYATVIETLHFLSPTP